MRSALHGRGLLSRTLFAVALLALCTAALTGVAAADDASPDEMAGNGTAENPYVITDVHELQAIQQDRDAHYVLGSDIDADGTGSWHDGRGFEPIGGPDACFSGVFDGRNHTISDLTVDRTGLAAPFHCSAPNGTIRNVRLDDVAVSGSTAAGLVLDAGDLSHVVVSGRVQALDTAAGIAHNATAVERSGATVEVEGLRTSGLVYALAPNGRIERSYAVLDSNADDASGLVAELGADATLSDVYTAGRIDGAREVSGISYNDGHEGGFEVSRAYTAANLTGESVVPTVPDATFVRHVAYDRTAVPNGSVPSRATGLTPAELNGSDVRYSLEDFDFDSVWAVTDGTPVLQWQIEAVDLSVSERRLVVGDSVNATVRLDLVGGGTRTATATADYEPNGSAVTVDAGTVNATAGGTATVTASVGSRSDTETIEVSAPATLRPVNATVDRNPVARRSPVTVGATVENRGDFAGTERLTLEANGSVVDSRTLTLGARARRSVTFEWVPASTGSYNLTLDGRPVETVTVTAMPDLRVADASVRRETVLTGTEVTVSATVPNPSVVTGTETLSFSVDGETRRGSVLTVGPERNATAEFAWTPTEAGTYNLTVNGTAAGTVVAVDSGAVSVANVSAPAAVSPNETVTATATISNDAEKAVPVAVTYARDGEAAATETVAADPGETTVTFEPTPSVTGTVTHAVSAADTEATAATEVREPASFEVSELADEGPLRAGSEATVTATVENTGGVAGQETVVLTFDGEPVTEETVSLAAGGTVTVSASVPVREAGGHTYAVEVGDDSASASVTVEADAAETTPVDTELTTTPVDAEPTETPSETETTPATTTPGDTADGFGPGFGAVAALLAVLTVGVLKGTRR